MPIDLSGFKVIYNERVLRALSLDSIELGEGYPEVGKSQKAKFLSIFAINEDGNVVAICDEAWRFQFIPVVGKEGR